jgi:aminomethyltransferase
VSDKKTALFDVHSRLGAKLIPFGGWTMPVEYTGIAAEHNAVRNAAGLFDVSHMGEFEITGSGALSLLQHVTSNDAGRLQDGQAQYSALPNDAGGVVDDLLVYRFSPERFMVVVNAANIRKDLDWLSANNNAAARIEDISDATSLLSVQGPRALSILQEIADQNLALIPPYHFRRGRAAGTEVTFSRTGYTGEDGFELYFPSLHAETLWNAIMAVGQPRGLLPAGLGARNTLRLEARLLLYGNDIDDNTSLLEAGLGWIVKFEKGPFIGRQALEQQKSSGIRRKLVGFEMIGREIARDHYPVRVDGREVGHVTSGSPSITLRKNIGLTYLPATNAAPGTAIEVVVRGRACEAQVVKTPFYRRNAA